MLRKHLFFFLLLSAPTLVQAQEDDGHFDKVVAELKAALNEEQEPAPKRDTDFEDTQIELGGALAGNYLTIGDNGAPEGSAMMKGFDLHFGIDLFSPHWVAEAGFRSFGAEKMASNYSASLQEYELRIVHKSDLQKKLQLRAGAGMSALLLKTMDSRDGRYSESLDEAPGWVALIGLDKVVTPKLSLGPELSFRSPLVHDTATRTSLDASLRLDFHF